jgi:hypothetical protein
MPGGAKAKLVTLASDRAELMDGLFDAQVVALRGKRHGIEYPDNDNDGEADQDEPSPMSVPQESYPIG